MSTTRSQKRRNDQQSTNENVSEGFISPVVEGNPCPLNQDDEVAGPSKPKSPLDRKQPFRKFEGFFKRGNNVRNQESTCRISKGIVEILET